MTQPMVSVRRALVEETYAAFAAWDFELSKRDNLDRLRDEHVLEASGPGALAQVAAILHRRFDPAGCDRPLVILAQKGVPMREWRALLLWHMTRGDPLLRHFFETWLPEVYATDRQTLCVEDAADYLQRQYGWSEKSTRRVAAGLLKMAVDFALLGGRKARKFISFHLSERCFIYLLHAMHEEVLSSARVVMAPEWKLFRLCAEDVHYTLLRLHQFRKVGYVAAGSCVELTLPFANSRECAMRMQT